ncbi:hypothetical protein ABLN87_12430 [Ruegeria sp. SCPT10]|uniref:hypothetical protein n=1 Tax=Ruegeria sp. SCP10 TaxID=3141377 RepID=UPI0033378167
MTKENNPNFTRADIHEPEAQNIAKAKVKALKEVLRRHGETPEGQAKIRELLRLHFLIRLPLESQKNCRSVLVMLSAQSGRLKCRKRGDLNYRSVFCL